MKILLPANTQQGGGERQEGYMDHWEIDFEWITARFFRNGSEILASYLQGLPLPVLVLNTGFVIEHSVNDPLESLIYKTFVVGAYTAEGFYLPKPGDNVIDCGANIGVFALYLAQMAPGIRIFCFEPATGTRARLETNIRNNKLGGQITVFDRALLDCETTCALNLFSSSGDCSFFAPSNLQPLAQESVSCVTLKTALNLCGVSWIDLLRIDVRGAEVEILGNIGGPEWERIRRIAIELHESWRPASLGQVVDFLTENGFEITAVITVDPDPVHAIVHAINRRSWTS